MWRNYLTVGLRALAKNKVYAFVNIFGLSLGIAACLMILTFVRYEFSYDSWLPGAENAYQLQDFYKPNERGGEEMKLQVTSYASGQALKKDFPQVEKLAFFTSPGITLKIDGQTHEPDRGVFTDGPLLDILQLPFVRGDRAHALDDTHSLVVSETEAKALFGGADPIGRTLTVMSGELTQDYRVTGIFKDLPKNTHMNMSLIARADINALFKDPGFFTSWNWQSGGWGDRAAGIAGGLAGALCATQTVSGALRRGGTRVGTGALVACAAIVVAALAWIPAVGYVVVLVLLALVPLLRRARPERYAGLRTLARDE